MEGAVTTNCCSASSHQKEVPVTGLNGMLGKKTHFFKKAAADLFAHWGQLRGGNSMKMGMLLLNLFLAYHLTESNRGLNNFYHFEQKNPSFPRKHFLT